MTMAGDFHGRLRQALGKESETSFARRAGIAKSALNRLLKGGSPTLPMLISLANTAGVSVEWLATGAAGARDIPVLGFAECGLKGWFNEVALSVKAHHLGSMGPNAFAVIAVGDSLRPAGIEQGFLCYCDPQDRPAHLDAVYIRKSDGTVSLKLYGGEDDTWLKVQGWLKPDTQGHQKPYVDQIRRDFISQLAPVVYVKRKL